ncbi:MAG: gamma-glutamylcyclotransferase [Syntrophobacteria bacterium]
MAEANSEETVEVFFYGSLKRGRELYFLEPLMELRLEVQPARIQGALLYDLGPYPGMVLRPDGGTVTGEVHRFRLPKETLAVLDEIEAYWGEGDPDNLYRRVRGNAEVAGGRLIPCWLYEYVGPMEHARLLENGIW